MTYDQFESSYLKLFLVCQTLLWILWIEVAMYKKVYIHNLKHPYVSDGEIFCIVWACNKFQVRKRERACVHAHARMYIFSYTNVLSLSTE